MKIDMILSRAMHFVDELVRPWMEKVDVIGFTEKSRILKIGEDYLVRLLRTRLSKKVSEEIASKLVSYYPEHGFVIDREEAVSIGLNVERPDGPLLAAIESVFPFVESFSAIGRLEEL